MLNVSRPLIGLLVATVAFFAVWTLALKPHSSTSGGGTSTTGLQSAIDKAHQAVTTSNKASVAHGGTVATAPSSTPTATSPSVASASPSKTVTHAATTPATKTHTSTKHAAKTGAAPAHAPRTAASREAAVVHALRQHKVVAILFYNTAGADDQLIKHELSTVPANGGKVFKLAVPVTELKRYPVVTQQVPLSGSPTLVLIDRSGAASTIVGFSDRFEIARRVAVALAVK